jgi:hypothetical protein
MLAELQFFGISSKNCMLQSFSGCGVFIAPLDRNEENA